MPKIKSTIVITPSSLNSGELPVIQSKYNTPKVPLATAIKNPNSLQNPNVKAPLYPIGNK